MSSFPDTFLIPFLFIFGSIIGSFLNVVIYRVPKKMSIIKPRSHCFSCKKSILARDNIPIMGYFLLNGRCRHCDTFYPSRYAFVELITALLTICVYFIYGIGQPFLIYLTLTYLLIAITFVDIDHFIIPNGFVLIGIGVLAFGLYFQWIPITWEDSLYGSLVFAGFLFTVGCLRRHLIVLG